MIDVNSYQRESEIKPITDQEKVYSFAAKNHNPTYPGQILHVRFCMVFYFYFCKTLVGRLAKSLRSQIGGVVVFPLSCEGLRAVFLTNLDCVILFFHIGGVIVLSNTKPRELMKEVIYLRKVLMVSVVALVLFVAWVFLDIAQGAAKAPKATPEPQPINLLKNGTFAKDFSGVVEGGWGSNDCYLQKIKDDGHGDKTSLKVTVSNYRDGDGKWLLPDVKLEAEQTYLFSVWYKTNARPKAMVRFTYTNGSESYLELKPIVPAANTDRKWTLYEGKFLAPVGAKSATAFVLLDGNGWLMTDDYAIYESEAERFERALLTLTFDDGRFENVETVLPALEEYGFKSTHFYMVSNLYGQESIDGMLALDAAGHEIGSHTLTHPDLTKLIPEQMEVEIFAAKDMLEAYLGHEVPIFAAPYGDFNDEVIAKVAERYRSNRGVNTGYNAKDGFEIYKTRVRSVYVDTTPEEIAEWVRYAQKDHLWLILLYHRVGDMPGPYDTTLAVFNEQLKVIAESGIAVVTYSEALDEIVPQLQ